MRRIAWGAGLLVAAGSAAVLAAQVESFAPQGEVKGVRQVAVRFSAPIVSLGDPRLPAPFEIECPAAGTGRWADSRNWVYDFERDLPAGLRCKFSLRPELVTQQGEPVERGEPFIFSTGGPAIVQTLPFEGTDVDEEQIFLLGLDAPPRRETVQANAYCDAQGVTERIPVEFVEGEARRALLDARKDFVFRFLQSAAGGGRPAQLQAAEGNPALLALRCQRRLPNGAPLRLVWSQGIESESGVPTSQDQAIAWRVRSNFEAKFSCQRATKDAQCLPILPMSLSFSAPIARGLAERIALKGSSGVVKATLPDPQQGGEFVDRVLFEGPFPERAQYTLELPPNVVDDAGRKLANQRRFPLQVRTDEYPPLAKFAGRFGIIELKGDGLLPVTLRNLEALVEARSLKIGKQEEDETQAQTSDRADQAINWLRKQLETSRGEEGGVVPGVYSRIADGDVMAMVRWLRKLREFEADRWRWDEKKQENVAEYRVGEKSLFTDQDKTRRIHVPKPQGARAFEVVGIPLKRPGFYVVELASPRLGASLLGGRSRPYYVQSAALVTNLSVHFKWGRESSLIWVTALDTGKPVAKAQLAVQDCAGKVYYRGETDAVGRARIAAVLPERERVPACLGSGDRQLVASARVADDLGVVFSDWNEGIANWRFNLRSGGWQGPFIATTVFDRTLLRAGEAVSMKHYYRRHTPKGFAYVPVDQLPKKALIRHLGSDEKYELPLKWDGRNIAESTWAIPAGARKGTYQVLMSDTLDSRPGRGPSMRVSGTFRVEEFRVPLMKAQISGPGPAQVRAQSVDLHLHLSYLSGGAAGATPVKIRGVVRPRSVSFPAYEGFTFANGRVQAGIERDAAQAWYALPYESDEFDEAAPPQRDGIRPLKTQALLLDDAGGAKVPMAGLPVSETPQELAAEMEYMDPNGETLTAATRVALWPARLLLGVKPDSWAQSTEQLKFQIVVLDLAGKAVKGQKIKAELFLRQPFSHRKRLVGGFYGFESGAEVKKLPASCDGVSDARGRVFCTTAPQVSGNIFIVAQARDSGGNMAYANASAWLAGAGQWWFDASNDDRIDVIPERKRYDPGQAAQLQVRMPFRDATALITVEREGVLDSFVQPLSGASPVIKLPVKPQYAPNVFVSVLVVRGRSDEVKPTALVDLGKPAFKMGTAEIEVGWRAHELTVQVAPERELYKTREKARVNLRVTQKAGGKPAAGEVAVAVVDEGLLDLAPNDSWQLLESMMRLRGTEVQTATASMQVVGKRHYGRKALAQGGGGGRETARELFDTLLVWKGRVPVDAKGNASIEVPLNDSLTSFRVVAVADAGTGQFGTGQARIRTSQDVQVLSGLPPVVREGDRFEARFTVRNASARSLGVNLAASVNGEPLPGADALLKAGEAREVAWPVSAPVGARALQWDVTATARSDAGPAATDRLRATQRVTEAVPVATVQATIAQLDGSFSLPVAAPAGALPGRGGLRVDFKPRLGAGLESVREFMQRYAYTCLEQKVSRAVALRDAQLWSRSMSELPAHLDRDGLARYFVGERLGSDTLTAYVLSVAHEAGWAIPEDARQRMQTGLRNFIEGRVVRDSALPTADLSIRKVAALDALSRFQPIEPALLSTIAIEPNLWPTSAVIDWYGTVRRSQWPDREQRLRESGQILRSRLNFQGTTLGFSTERQDYLWWLMVSGDVNANRMLVAMFDEDTWREDLPRLVRGTLGRQQHGRWNTTVANAWGVLAMEKFSERYERDPVSGQSAAGIVGAGGVLDWSAKPDGGALELAWPSGEASLSVTHGGQGKPWVTVESRAALPLTAPLTSGFRITRTVTPVAQREPGALARGDTVRVRLEIEAQSDMSWVVVNDPVPAGSAILGRGIGGESQILAESNPQRNFVWPTFEERTFEAFRAYYRFIPKGTWSVDYTMRLNNAGRFELPPTRVEAMYAPEMFGMVPNEPVTVNP